MLAPYYRGQTKFQIGDNTNLFDFTENTNVSHAHHLAAAALLTTLDREEQGQSKPLDNEKVDGEAFFITSEHHIPCSYAEPVLILFYKTPNQHTSGTLRDAPGSK